MVMNSWRNILTSIVGGVVWDGDCEEELVEAGEGEGERDREEEVERPRDELGAVLGGDNRTRQTSPLILANANCPLSLWPSIISFVIET